MKKILLLVAILIISSCSTNKCYTDQYIEEQILTLCENYVIESRGENDPYRTLIQDYDTINNGTEAWKFNCHFVQLLNKIHLELGLPDHKECMHYYFSYEVSTEGMIYLSYNRWSDGFLADIAKSYPKDKQIVDYVESVFDSGDIPPSLIAGFGKWEITKDSPPKKRLLFFLHILILSSRCAGIN